MALDTDEKRLSAINPFSPWRGLFPLPDGTVDPVDRQIVGYAFGSGPAGFLLLDVGTAWRIGRRSIVADEKLVKTIDANQLYEMDFTDQLDTGETLSGNPTVTAEPATLTIEDETSSTTKSQARISGGDDGTNYLLRFNQTTSDGNTLEAIGQLSIREKD